MELFSWNGGAVLKTLAAPQAYRGLAAMMVVFYHAHLLSIQYFLGCTPTFFLRFGNAGVSFFFVLSGFVMIWAHERDLDHPERTGSFFRKRITRIYPVYWVITLILLPFWLFVPSFGLPYHKEVPALFKSLLLWPQAHEPHLSVGWTLTHEMLFYVVFASLLLSRRAGTFLMLGWTAAILMLGWKVREHFPANFLLNPLNLLFLLGMVAATGSLRLGSLKKTAGLWVFLAGNLLFILALVLEKSWLSHLDPVFIFGPSSAMILAGSMNPTVDAFFRKRRSLLFLGTISYSLYLAHFPAMSAAAKITTHLGITTPVAGTAIILMAALAAGIGLHVCAERPLIKALKKS